MTPPFSRRSADPAPPAYARMLMWRTPGPHFSCTGAMHHRQRGDPPLPYLWVLRWHVAQGPALSPGQVSADGSGSLIGGGGVVIVGPVLGDGHPPPGSQDSHPDSTSVRSARRADKSPMMCSRVSGRQNGHGGTASAVRRRRASSRLTGRCERPVIPHWPPWTAAFLFGLPLPQVGDLAVDALQPQGVPDAHSVESTLSNRTAGCARDRLPPRVNMSTAEWRHV